MYWPNRNRSPGEEKCRKSQISNSTFPIFYAEINVQYQESRYQMRHANNLRARRMMWLEFRKGRAGGYGGTTVG